MKRAFAVLAGGRPMERAGFAFTDAVTGDAVYYFIDAMGREWMATGPWALFRVRR